MAHKKAPPRLYLNMIEPPVGRVGIEPTANRLRICSVDRYGTCPCRDRLRKRGRSIVVTVYSVVILDGDYRPSALRVFGR